MERVADLRTAIQDLDVAKGVFKEIALLSIALAKKDAVFENRIAKLKAEHEEETRFERVHVGAYGDLLAHFIEQHKNLFADPRKIKTSMGSFGLQAVSELAIDQPDRIEQYLLDAGYEDCYETVRKLIKPAIKKRIEAGEKMPGAKIVSGDTAVYKVDKTLIDQARETTE